jgi:hypothetical protein
MNDDEVWRGIPGFPDYMVSNRGNVVSHIHRKPRVLKGGRVGRYTGFMLKHPSGALRTVYRHRLVAEAFHGPCPPGMECCHNDSDPQNCAASNLRWDTRANNHHDKVAAGTAPRGERHPMAKLTKARIAEMKTERSRTGHPYRAIASQFGISTMTAYRAITGKSWNWED